MNANPSATALAPSPRGAQATQTFQPSGGSPEPKTMRDLLYDGFYLVHLLRSGQAPQTAELLRQQVKAFLLEVDRNAAKLGVGEGDLRLIRYAFCATLDEVIMRCDAKLRHEWQRQPLQLAYFGDQLGGERFFTQLEAIRREGTDRRQVLEVFHMCLLMGFQGKYVFEGQDQLHHLTARLGEEITHLKGKRAGFAPHGAPPDQVSHHLRNDLPLWVVCSFFALLGVLGFIGLRFDLTRQVATHLADYHQVIKVVPEPAHITITLP
jgi:type VI secretion system protein ImpK